MALSTRNLEYSVTTTAIFVRQPQAGLPWTIGNAGGSNIFGGSFGLASDSTLTGTEAQIKALAAARLIIPAFSRVIVPADVTSVGLVTGTGYTSLARVQAGEQDPPDPAYVAVADFDADGILDLATVGDDAGELVVRLGEGADGQWSGTFADGTSYLLPNRPIYVAAADFDADGILDLAVHVINDHEVKILLGTGSCLPSP